MCISFYHDEERLVQIGCSDNDLKNYFFGERREVFEIAEDEQLIGCELEYDENCWFCCVTWLKMKTIF